MGKISKLIFNKQDKSNGDTEKNYNIFNFSVTGIAFIINAILLYFLPKEIPMQWANDGSVSYTLPSIIGVWIIPCILLIISIQYYSKRKTNIISSLMLLGILIINCIMFGLMIGA